MTRPQKRDIPIDEETTDEETAAGDAATSGPISKKGRKQKGLHTSLTRLPSQFTPKQQAHIASKDDCSILVGFSIYEPHGSTDSTRYRQVRSPMGGGIRYPRVMKESTKEELINIIKPLFFPDGKSCHGEVDDFIFDIATDVKGTQLMRVHESVAQVVQRLKIKHFRCYLLAKALDVDSDKFLG